MPPLILVTGFPGFIGRRLVRALLERDPEARVIALVEERFLEDAERAASETGVGERIELLAGDITARDLGVGEQQADRLTAEVTSVHHLAAVYNLAVPLAVAQRVNVAGTGNVVELCRRCERLERLNYVSTAYVAGDRNGVVYEHELVLGQGFKNHYESTKFQAEVWVQREMDRVPTTIYRPAIVVGDSRTGETQKFDGPYYMLRTISRSVERGEPIAQFGAADAPFNVVPVDFIVDAIVAAAGDEAAVGETLHLVDPDPVSACELLTLLSHEYGGRGPSLRVPPAVVENALRFKRVREMFAGAPRESIRYLNHEVSFDTRRADDLLRRHDMRCPRFGDYVGAIVDFYRQHEDDPAFMS